MHDRNNTIAGWALFSGIVALGLGSLSAHYYGADKPEHPEKQGYAIEGVVSSAEGAGGAAEEPIEARLAAGDPAKGEAVFKKCQSCHTADQGGANGIGPNLFAILGGPVAGRAGFGYSDDLKAKGGNWDFAAMDAWLKNPKAYAAGTKMTFAGLADGQDRANVIVYLNSKGSNLPLPAVPAAAEGAAPAEGAAADATASEGAAPAEGAGAEAAPTPAA